MDKEPRAIRGRLLRAGSVVRPGVRRLVLALTLTSSAFLLLLTALALRRTPAPSWLILSLAGAGVAASAVMGYLAVERLSRKLSEIEDQRDAFFEELTRLSKVSSLGEVSSSIAHDLNNPLAILNEEAGWLSDLLGGAGGSDEAAVRREMANSVDQIRAQIRRGREISRRILNWARETEGEGGRVDLHELLTKTLYLLESDMAEVRVQVVRRFATDLPRVGGSVAELRQVFLNLTKNALDSMRGRGGTLTLATERAGDAARVSVSDTGIGIPAENLARVFEPFFTTKPGERGTGLGLSISTYIVKKLGGTIEVESRVGEGTTFHVTLPAARGAPGTTAMTGGTDEGHQAAARR
jgi:two-component system NtrC family sensor kinase